MNTKRRYGEMGGVQAYHHMAFNSVCLGTGMKYTNTFTDYYKGIRRISDKLCQEKGLSVIKMCIRDSPKSVHADRIEENFAVGDFALSDADMARIDRMDTAHSLILDISSPKEMYRLHNIRFEQ